MPTGVTAILFKDLKGKKKGELLYTNDFNTERNDQILDNYQLTKTSKRYKPQRVLKLLNKLNNLKSSYKECIESA
jgi:hypothetical protein